MSRLISKFRIHFNNLAQNSIALKKEIEYLEQLKKENASDFEKAHNRYVNKLSIIDKEIIENRKKQVELKAKFSDQMLAFNTQLPYRELRKLWEIPDGPLI